jgi:protein-tyrosine-phosphatase
VGIEEFTDLRLRLDQACGQLCKEFEGIYDEAEIRVMLEQSARELEGASVASFVPVLAHRFTRERLRAQAQTEGKLEKTLIDVVFVSLTGGGRAQIGAALLDRKTSGAVNVHAAATGAALDVDSNVRVVLEEVGIDAAEAYTRPLSQEVLAGADIVVTMGRTVGEVTIPDHLRHLDWRVGDPAGAELQEIRRVRDDIDRRVEALAAELRRAAEDASAPVLAQND